MRIISSLVSFLLTISWIFAIAFYPIAGQNSFNKPGMWLFVFFAIIIYGIVIIDDYYLKRFNLLSFYQILVLFVSILCAFCGLLLTVSEFLKLFTLAIGIISLVNTIIYFFFTSKRDRAE
ncbi:hypothetical protein [Streptococcus sobrinus]|uniref:hypothetical protein n=1 Tax=Streptococcus sobrinus TaxID=1310 RepID=UPI0003676E20|nr:hypothetical protein [Streptococcus sobrinus]OZV23312.1 hypothetical protein RO09_02195 [Streptococcus sobrinus]